MSHPQNIDPRLWHLVNAAFDGTISPQETRELESMLESDPTAREFYIDFLTVNNRIRWMVNSQRRGMDFLNAQLDRPKRSVVLGFLGDAAQNGLDFINHHTPYSFILLLVFFVGAIAASISLLNLRHPHFNSVSAESVYVAQITAVKDCEWSVTMDPPAEDAKLEIGRQLKILKGLVQITYSNKAVVLLEGPASYTVDSPNSGFLDRGKMTVQAATDQAKNFTITTPQARFVDLGTEFGVLIDLRGRTIASVFSGKVTAEAKRSHGGWSAPLLLRNEESAVSDGPEMIRTVSMRGEYPSLQHVPPVDPVFQRWLNVRQELRSRSDLAAYYDFQPDPSHPDVLINRSLAGASRDGQIIGANWVDGRLPGKKALEFKKPGNGVRIDLPDEMAKVTLIAWVNIEDLPNQQQSLLMSDGWKRAYAAHWMLKTDGRMRISVQHKSADMSAGIGDTNRLKPDEWQFPKDSFNQWCMLASIFDSTNQQITHYFNGAKVETQTFSRHAAVVFGPVMIGTWNVAGETDEKYPERTLFGRMDEMMIFADALSSEDIQKIYDSSRP